jgi:hypothetical protein
MNEPISVEARFARDGSATPLSFTWRGVKYSVASIGRRWEKDGVGHLLVMDPSGEVFEIAYQPEGGCWRLCDAPGRRARPGRPA